MTLTWRATALGLAVSCTLVGCAPAGADAEREPAAATCGLGALPNPGEVRTVLESDDLREGAFTRVGAVLADGSVVVEYDLNPIDEDDPEQVATEEPEPGLLLVREDSCERMPLPTIDDGPPVEADPLVVAADDEGRIYLFDRPTVRGARLVRGTPGGDDWETVAEFSAELVGYGVPKVAVSNTGEVFVGTDFLVSRVTPEGDLEPLAGTGEGDGQAYPLPDPGMFPRAGTSAPLTKVGGLAATPSGTLVLTTFQTVLELDASATLRLLADPATTAGQDGAIVKRTFSGSFEVGSFFVGLHVTEAGEILVSENLAAEDDDDRQRLLSIRGGQSTVVLDLEDALYLPDGQSYFPGDEAVVLDSYDGIVVYGLPDN